jgi:protoporphyrinogen oxidase
MKVAILGAGISGISAGYHLDRSNFEVDLYESKNSWGGLLDNFSINGDFTFDTFIHLSFTKNTYVKSLFDKSSESIVHNPVSYNLSNGKWIKHPAQFNLSPLNFSEKFKIIRGFIKRNNYNEVNNYKDWLYKSYGKYFSDNYPIKYTKKYWTTNPENLTTNWLGTRFNVPKLSQIIKGSVLKTTENFYYANEMRYPKTGGYKSYLNYMANNLNINLNKKAVKIDYKQKHILFEDGITKSYNKLVSTLPLPELLKLITEVPNSVMLASKKLLATSGQLVSIAFNKEIDQHLWYYIYDNDFLPSRAWSPNLKSKSNTPLGKSSVQFETYYSKLKPKLMERDELIDHIINKAKLNNLFTTNDIEAIDYREIKYANIIFDFNRTKNLNIVHKFLDEIGIEYCGRFGEWDYLWSDQCVLSGKKIAKKINKTLK